MAAFWLSSKRINPSAIAFNFLGLLTNIIFGAIGGLIGGAIFKSRTPAAPPPAPV